MNDHDFDLELKHRAKAETEPVPVGFEGRLLAVVDELPERAAAKRPGRNILRPALAAAAMIAVLTGTMLAAGAAAGFDFVTFFGGTKTDRVSFVNEDGAKVTEECTVIYEAANSDFIYFPVEELPEAVREAADAGNGVFLDLPTWESVEEFIGLDIANSRTLEEQAERKDLEVKTDNGPYKTYQHMVFLSGEAPKSIQVGAQYRLAVREAADAGDWAFLGLPIPEDEIKITFNVYIRTDAVPQEFRDGTWLGRVDFYGETWEREDYLTAGGLEAVLIHNLTTSDVEAVFTLNGMGYQIGAYGYGYDREQVVTVLKEVLDGFQ